MIKVTRLNGSPITLNADLIEFLESTPDTIVCLTTGRKIMVKESPDEIVSRVLEYNRLSQSALSVARHEDAG